MSPPILICWLALKPIGSKKGGKWERKEVLDSLSVSATRMMDMSDKNYMARVRTLSNPSRPQDATTCISAIKEIDSKLNQLAQIHESLMHQKEGLFEPSSVTLKSWAKEQFAYSQKTLATTSDLKDKFQSLKEEILETQKKLADQHKFSLASAEARRKRKWKRDNASKAKQRKIDAQQTRTRDLLKLLCQDEEVFTVVADIDDGGELKLKRALELQEINFSVLRTLQPRSHYNSLLFLRKEGFFAEDAVKIDERLEIMREKVKTFKGYTSASQASDEDSD